MEKEKIIIGLIDQGAYNTAMLRHVGKLTKMSRRLNLQTTAVAAGASVLAYIWYKGYCRQQEQIKELERRVNYLTEEKENGC